MKKLTPMAAVAALCAVPQSALAHVGDHGLAGSFNAGVLHPLMGADHLIMLVAMGALAGKVASRKGQLSMISAVLLTMLAGMVLGLFNGAVLGMETAILASLFVAAAAIWRAPSRSVASRALTAVGIAMVMAHGWAHGVELGSASLAAFAPGMLVGSFAAMMVGVMVAKRLPANIIASSVATSGLLLAAIG